MPAKHSVVYAAPGLPEAQLPHDCAPSLDFAAEHKLKDGSVVECDICGQGWVLCAWLSKRSGHLVYSANERKIDGVVYCMGWDKIRWWNYKIKRRLTHGQ